MNWKLSLPAAALVLALAYYAFSGHAPQSAAKAPANTTSHYFAARPELALPFAAANSQSVAAKHSDTAAPDARSKQDSALLRAALRNTGDYQQFVQQALRHPEQGGVLYAMSTAQSCGKMQDVMNLINVEANQLYLNPARAQAVADFKQRCNINLPQVYARLQQEKELAGRDPLWQLENDLQSAVYDKRKQALQAALDSQNPQLLFESQALSYTPGMNTDAQKTFFNGKWLTQQESQQYRLALRLAACDFGQHCQQGDLWLQEKCIIQSECAQSRQEYLERFVYPLQPEARAGVEKFRQALGKAVQARSVATFMPG